MFKGKAIYQPWGRAGEYSEWACNIYNGCLGGCKYCFNKTGRFKKVLGGDVPTLKKAFKDEADFKKVFLKEVEMNLRELRYSGLFFNFTSDVFGCNADLFRWAIHNAFLMNVPVKILTKQTQWITTEFLSLFEGNEKEIAFGFTLTGMDDQEPGCDPNIFRVTKLGHLHQLGFRTWASFEPIIDFSRSMEMFRASLGYCDHYKFGLLKEDKPGMKLLEMFFYDVNDYLFKRDEISVYLKDSIINYLGWDREKLPRKYVGSDFNIFNT